MDRIRVRGFQSIGDCTLELGGLTVVTGASSSGKSAFLRAARLLCANNAAPSYVRTGCTSAVVEADLGDGTTVWAERGRGISTYGVRTADGEQTYPKAGTSVPEDVAALLRTPRQDDGTVLNFAFQFDPPFLLGASGAQAARTVGELSGAALLTEAAREASRRRTEASSRLRTRRGDETTAAGEAGRYVGLRAERDALEVAEGLVADVRVAADELAALEGLTRDVDALEVRLAEVEASVPATTDVGDLLASAEADARDLAALEAAVRDVERAARLYVAATGGVEVAVSDEETARARAEEAATRDGACVVCGRTCTHE